MRAFECSVQITPEGRVEIPAEMAKLLPAACAVRAIFLVGDAESTDEAAWAQLAAEQFAAGYSEADAIYDRI